VGVSGEVGPEVVAHVDEGEDVLDEEGLVDVLLHVHRHPHPVQKNLVPVNLVLRLFFLQIKNVLIGHAESVYLGLVADGDFAAIGRFYHFFEVEALLVFLVEQSLRNLPKIYLGRSHNFILAVDEGEVVFVFPEG